MFPLPLLLLLAGVAWGQSEGGTQNVTNVYVGAMARFDVVDVGRPRRRIIRLKGYYRGIESGLVQIDITKTGDSKRYPKGRASVPVSRISSFRVEPRRKAGPSMSYRVFEYVVAGPVIAAALPVLLIVCHNGCAFSH